LADDRGRPKVTRGEESAMLEAMRMGTAVRAEIDGGVAEVVAR